MADEDRDRKTAVSPTEAEPPVRSRKPYVKPAFRFDRVFETTALACGKVTATQGQCKANKKVS